MNSHRNTSYAYANPVFIHIYWLDMEYSILVVIVSIHIQTGEISLAQSEAVNNVDRLRSTSNVDIHPAAAHII